MQIENKVIVKIKRLRPDAILPTYAEPGAAGMDIYAMRGQLIQPGNPTLIRCGFAIELPDNYEAQVRSRSGLALKHGIHVLNSPGTVDSSYRGEIGAILHNASKEVYQVQAGDRIAQIVINHVPTVRLVEVTELSETQRGVGGFGSTDDGAVKSPMIETADHIIDKENYTPLRVLRSPAGFYLGTMYRDPETGNEEPGSRDSQYFKTKEAAQNYLDEIKKTGDTVSLRSHP